MRKVSPIDIKEGKYYILKDMGEYLWECTYVFKEHDLIRIEMKNLRNGYVTEMTESGVYYHIIFEVDESEYPEYFV